MKICLVVKHLITLLLITLLLSVSSVVMANAIKSYTADQKHAAAAGGKDVVVITLAAPKNQCVQFEKVSVSYKRRRYGQAQILKSPAIGCNPAISQCQVEVAWEHAPAGRLTYRLEVTWRPTNNC